MLVDCQWSNRPNPWWSRPCHLRCLSRWGPGHTSQPKDERSVPVDAGAVASPAWWPRTWSAAGIYWAHEPHPVTPGKKRQEKWRINNSISLRFDNRKQARFNLHFYLLRGRTPRINENFKLIFWFARWCQRWPGSNTSRSFIVGNHVMVLVHVKKMLKSKQIIILTWHQPTELYAT